MNAAAAILQPSIGWWLLGGMSIFWVALGLCWGRNNNTLATHMLAGRNVGLALGAATGVATWVTSNTTMLAPQFALQMGVWGMLAYSTAAVGLFKFAPLARRIRTLMPEGYTSARVCPAPLRSGRLGMCFWRSPFLSTRWLAILSCTSSKGCSWSVITKTLA